MKSYSLSGIAAFGCVMLASCYPYPENREEAANKPPEKPSLAPINKRSKQNATA